MNTTLKSNGSAYNVWPNSFLLNISLKKSLPTDLFPWFLKVSAVDSLLVPDHPHTMQSR